MEWMLRTLKKFFKQTPDVSIYVDKFNEKYEDNIKEILKVWGARKAYQCNLSIQIKMK